MTTAEPGANIVGQDRALASSADGDDVLSVDGLSIFAGDKRLVTDVSFTLRAGQRLGIIGASGSGKTLTCLATAGLLPDGLRATGSIRVTGFDGDLVRTPERRLATIRGRLLGMVFQEPLTALNPTMRVSRQIRESLRLHRDPTPKATRAQRRKTEDATVAALLTAVGFADPDRIAGSYPHQLSGGQVQRVALAMALAHRPAVLICDEPTTALDVRVQETVLGVIDERLASVASALIFISHDLAVVARLCDDVLVMWNGSIVERGRTVDVLREPRHEHTRQLLAAAYRGAADGTFPDGLAPVGSP